MTTIFEPVLEFSPKCGAAVVEQASLSADQAAMLASFRQDASTLLPSDFKAASPRDQCHLTEFIKPDQCLLRYLRASKWNLAKAKQMLSDTLRWRLDYKPHLIAPPDVEKECLTGKIYLNGFDMAGRPIVYMKPVRENSNSQEGNVRNVVYQLEQAIRVMPTGVEKICLVIDFTNNPISKSVSLGTAKQIVDILSKHYVERLGVSFIYNAPWYFTAFYSTVSPWLDPVTKAKIRFIDQKKQIKALKAYEEAVAAGDKDAKVSNDAMATHIEQDVLETSVGGKFDFDYKHEVYWARVSELYQKTVGSFEDEKELASNGNVSSASSTVVA